MGKISSEAPQKQTTASHFSHPHPLNLLSHQTIPNPSPNHSCSACKLKLSGMIYSCAACEFFLHKSCFEMPNKITHPSHKGHAFDLLPTPAYAEGAYNCDACNETGTGFVYHCKPCGIDLHMLCAAAPLSVATSRHAHKLRLVFESPYPDKSFRCDVCGSPGLNHWLYRCDLCGFDAHLKCVSASAADAPPPEPAVSRVAAAAVGVPAGVPDLAAFGAAVSRQQSERLAQLQSLLQVIQNNNAVTQSGVAGFGGVGSGLQQLTQYMSGLNNSGFGGGGGGGVPGLHGFGGGGGQEFLPAYMNGGGGGGSGVPGFNAFAGGGGQGFPQAFMNAGGGGGGGIPGLNAFGGGGGQEFLQALMNGGGGGGGIESLQSLLGGSGGFDFLGGIGGFF